MFPCYNLFLVLLLLLELRDVDSVALVDSSLPEVIFSCCWQCGCILQVVIAFVLRWLVLCSLVCLILLFLLLFLVLLLMFQLLFLLFLMYFLQSSLVLLFLVLFSITITNVRDVISVVFAVVQVLLILISCCKLTWRMLSVWFILLRLMVCIIILVVAVVMVVIAVVSTHFHSAVSTLFLTLMLFRLLMCIVSLYRRIRSPIFFSKYSLLGTVEGL